MATPEPKDPERLFEILDELAGLPSDRSMPDPEGVEPATLSAELVDRGIRVLALSPGPVHTAIFDRMGTPEEVGAVMVLLTSTVPMKRMGTVEEIANAALFLISDESSFMLGAELVVDGGKSQL